MEEKVEGKVEVEIENKEETEMKEEEQLEESNSEYFSPPSSPPQDDSNSRKRDLDEAFGEQENTPNKKTSLDSSVDSLSESSDKLPTDFTVTNNESEAIYVRNLKRPLQVSDLKDLLGQHGTVEHFWINKIKSECYVVYTKQEEAVAAKNAIHGLKWPDHGTNLTVSFVTKKDAINPTTGGSLDDLFRKTKTTPHIYWKPLTDEEVEIKKKRLNNNNNNK